MRDCQLVAYANSGFRVVGIYSRTFETAKAVADLRAVPRVYRTLDELLADPAVEIVDIAVPPLEQPGVIRQVVASGRRVRGILAQKPLAMSRSEAKALVEACAKAGIVLQVNQNMRYDHSVRALRDLLDGGLLGEPVLVTVEMRAIPHWMPWAQGGRSLSTFVMSIHHLDLFRYWLGDPTRVLASTRPDPRTRFAHEDGINLYVLEYSNGARASGWDDVWAGPTREGAAPTSSSAGDSRAPLVWPRARSAGRAGQSGYPARSTTPPSPTGERGIDRAGRKPGFPTLSREPWRGFYTPSKTAASPTFRVATTSRRLPYAKLC